MHDGYRISATLRVVLSALITLSTARAFAQSEVHFEALENGFRQTPLPAEQPDSFALFGRHFWRSSTMNPDVAKSRAVAERKLVKAGRYVARVGFDVATMGDEEYGGGLLEQLRTAFQSLPASPSPLSRQTPIAVSLAEFPETPEWMVLVHAEPIRNEEQLVEFESAILLILHRWQGNPLWHVTAQVTVTEPSDQFPQAVAQAAKRAIRNAVTRQ